MSTPAEEAKSFVDDLDKDLHDFTPGSFPKVEDEPPKKEDAPPKKEDDDDDIDFRREPRKAKEKEKPEESIANLRKQRDEARQKNEAFVTIFGEEKPETIKPLVDFVKEKVEGPITDEAINNIISSLKESETRISELQEELEKRELAIQDLDVRSSAEFKNNYQKPYEDSVQSLFLEFASVTPDKKIIAPKATQAFHKFLLDNPEIEGVDLKAKLSEFASAYENESGEKPELPSITNLMKSLREFRSARASMNEAFVNWKNKKEQEQKFAQTKQQEEKEVEQKRNKKFRKDLVSKAYREFDLDSIPFIETKEAEELFREEYAEGEKIFAGEAVPTYDAVMAKGVKAKLWDRYAHKLKELIEMEEAINKGERNHLSGSTRAPSGGKESKSSKDWLDGVL